MIYKNRTLATVDIGTNSLLLLIANRDESGKITILHDEMFTPRLGENFRETNLISDAALDRACQALASCRSTVAAKNVEKMFLTATSAMREAKNQTEALKKMQEACGTEIEIIAPNEEARLTYISITADCGHERPSMVVDIGGGSTEVTWGLGPRFDGGRSLKFGTVKLLEGPLARADRPTPDQLTAARKEIDTYLMRITPLGELDFHFGTAGSFTHLASIDLGLENYEPAKIHGHVLTPATVVSWVEKFSAMTSSERASLKGADPKRADLLLPGTLIIERLFKKFSNPSFTVLDRGIRYGKLFDQLRGFTPPISL